MAFSLSSTSIFPCSSSKLSLNNQISQPITTSSSSSSGRTRKPSLFLIRCETSPPPPESGLPPRSSRLGIGSPIIVVEAPKMIKTAASVPCLRVNSGLVKPGDVGRIVSRKPMDVWAVRLAIGTYLLDGKYFKALEFDE